MSIAEQLRYSHPHANPAQRSAQLVASTAAGARVFSMLLPALDRAVTRASRGRTSAPRLLAGLAVLVLTSTGRRSGRPRETHLIAVPHGDMLALIGTNFGQPSTPAWVLNLEADPRARVTHHGVTLDVLARPAADQERAQVLADSARVYRGYRKYQERITGRTVRVFVLEPAAAR